MLEQLDTVSMGLSWWGILLFKSPHPPPPTLLYTERVGGSHIRRQLVWNVKSLSLTLCSLFSIKYHSVLVWADLYVLHVIRKGIKDTRSWDSGTESRSAVDDFFSVTSMLLPETLLCFWFLLFKWSVNLLGIVFN